MCHLPPPPRQAAERALTAETGFGEDAARRNHARMLLSSVFRRRDGAWLTGGPDARRAALRKVSRGARPRRAVCGGCVLLK